MVETRSRTQLSPVNQNRDQSPKPRLVPVSVNPQELPGFQNALYFSPLLTIGISLKYSNPITAPTMIPFKMLNGKIPYNTIFNVEIFIWKLANFIYSGNKTNRFATLITTVIKAVPNSTPLTSAITAW